MSCATAWSISNSCSDVQAEQASPRRRPGSHPNLRFAGKRPGLRPPLRQAIEYLRARAVYPTKTTIGAEPQAERKCVVVSLARAFPCSLRKIHSSYGRSHRSPQQPFGALADASRSRGRRRDHGSACPDRRKLHAVDPLDEAAGQEVQGDPASSLDRKISRAANEGGATYGTDQIHCARTCLARRDRLRHCQHRRHCRVVTST